MMRSIQIGNEVVSLTWTEKEGKVDLKDMVIVPLVVYDNINKGFRYDKVL